MDSNYLTGSCSYCGAEQIEHYKFCSSCGKRNSESSRIDHLKDKFSEINIKSIIIYSVLTIVLLLIMAFTDESFELLVIWTVGFAIIDLGFAAYQPVVYKLMDIRKIKILPIISIVLICIGSGFVVSFLMDELNLILFEKTDNTLDLFYHLDQPLLYSIIVIGVFPALFEELAFRGFIFNNFKLLGGIKSAVWGSSFLFALIHFSLLSIIWLVPFALLLSFYRNRYNTIIYGIIGHFTHNTTTLLIEYFNIY